MCVIFDTLQPRLKSFKSIYIQEDKSDIKGNDFETLQRSYSFKPRIWQSRCFYKKKKCHRKCHLLPYRVNFKVAVSYSNIQPSAHKYHTR